MLDFSYDFGWKYKIMSSLYNYYIIIIFSLFFPLGASSIKSVAIYIIIGSLIKYLIIKLENLGEKSTKSINEKTFNSVRIIEKN